VYAFIWLGASGRTPQWVLQSVASGWLGRAAFSGGLGAAALGLASHLGISVAAAAIYGAAVRGSAWVRVHWIAGGIAFGVLVYLFMNFVVIPLSAAPFGPSWAPRAFIQGFISHAVVFGLPIAWVWRRALRP
jgi:uncharacterized membrane protein YagU involved in acid resistance